MNVDPLAVGMVHGDEHEHLPPVKRVETNLNVRAAIIHVIGDFVQSVGVLCAAILIKFKVGRIRHRACFSRSDLLLAGIQIGRSDMHIRLLHSRPDHDDHYSP